MSISPGFTAAGIREFVLEYQRQGSCENARGLRPPPISDFDALRQEMRVDRPRAGQRSAEGQLLQRGRHLAGGRHGRDLVA